MYFTSQQLPTSTLQAMGIDTSEGFTIFRPDFPRTLMRLDYDVSLINAFKGIPILLQHVNSKISRSRAIQLNQVGVLAYAGDLYHKGLATLAMKNANTALDLVNFKITLEKNCEGLNVTEHYCQLLDIYQEARHKMLTEVTVLSGSDLISLLDLCNLALTQICCLALPSDFLSTLNDPSTFIKNTAPLVGRYVVAHIQETAHMFIDEFDQAEPTEFTVENTGLLQLETPWDDRRASDPVPAFTKYPNQKSTSKWNKRQSLASKARLANRIYNKLVVSLPRMDDTRKESARNYLKSLRPSMRSLREHYVQQGDSDAIANKLVTFETYPFLPMVWLTKQQQTILLDVVDGQAEQHEQLINNGFM